MNLTYCAMNQRRWDQASKLCQNSGGLIYLDPGGLGYYLCCSEND
jgi:hypothetical protein